MKKFIEPVLILIIISFTVIPLFHKGYFPVHDDEQVGRLIEMDTALKDLQIPPRWTPNLGFGYGYPLFNFYPPFIYYVGEIFHLTGISFIDSTKIVYFLGFFLSAYFMYLFAKEIFGKPAGVLAAVFYSYAPYKALDAYVRGSLSEFFAFVFFPLIFYAFHKKNILLSSISLALLILTHNLTALIFFPFLLLYLLYLLFLQKDRFKTFKNYLLSLVLSFMLSAYFTLPSLFEKSYTMVDKILTGELANFRLHFVALRQLVDSPWGYGGSIPGPFDGLSFEIGKLHIALIIVVLILIAFNIFKKILHSSKLSIVHCQLSIFIALCFLVSLFMTLTISRPIWEILTPLWYLQFPWRFLGLVAFFGSILIGSVGYVIASPSIARAWQSRTLLISLLLVVFTMFFYKNIFVPQKYVDVNDSHYNSKEGLQWEISSMSYEYVPKEVKTATTFQGTTVLAITQNDLPKEKVSFLKGSGAILKQNIKSQSFDLALNITSEANISLSSYNFPGWSATLDGQKVNIDDNNDLHLITINNIPSGPHNLVVKFTNTPIRTLGNIISLISIIILAKYALSHLLPGFPNQSKFDK